MHENAFENVIFKMVVILSQNALFISFTLQDSIQQDL